MREANEALSLGAASTSANPPTGSKCNADLSPAPARQVVRKVVVKSDDEHDGNETEPADVDENTNDIEIVDYQSLKAMADADHKVRSYLTW